jgi:thiol-disulfide isomerase/thioredoxin
MKFSAGVVLLSVISLALVTSVHAQSAAKPSILGVWQGTAINHQQSVPVVLRISGTPTHLEAALLNGTDKSTATAASYTDGRLVLTFSYFARGIDAILQNGVLTGTFGGKRGGFFPITLHRAPLTPAPRLPQADIFGDWEIAVKTANGESAWQLRIAKSDTPFASVRAVIQRIDGDTGSLYSTLPTNFKLGDTFEVSHFVAAGSALYSITPQADGTLQVKNLLSTTDTVTHTARRPEQARKENLAPPTDTAQQTTMKDPNETLRFSFPDLSGKVISNTDPQFDGKVVIVAIGGSWCPNCHDEAPFLVDLYKQFHSKGLEIVNLSFEEEDQLKDPNRLRAFIARYGIQYTVLVAGNTDQLNEKITQANNLNCWPTSFFLGRDGKVKEIHAGYAGPGNPAANKALTKEVTELVEHLLSEPAPIHTASR